MKKVLYFVILILTFSCTKNIKQSEEQINIAELESSEDVILPAIRNNTWENHDWITEFEWSLSDGRDTVKPGEDHIYWHSYKTPYVKFEKFEMPPNSVLYQVRLRNEMFYFLYQTEETAKLFPIGNSLGTEPLDINFRDDFSRISLRRNRMPWGNQSRAGQQENPDYPLVGIWGSLPALEEYRLIDPANCLYYMDIDKEIPYWAVREGTYLLKQTGDNVFETISSFPDGELRLEMIDEQRIIITTQFTLPDEEGFLGPLLMSRHPINSRFLDEEEEY